VTALARITASLVFSMIMHANRQPAKPICQLMH
jgi:hypothetical protein